MFTQLKSMPATCALASVLGLSLLLSACGGQAVTAGESGTQTTPVSTTGQQQAAAPKPAAVQRCLDCGTVRSMVTVVEEGTSTGVGAAVGALVGGLAGNQVGGGSGKRIATVAGVVGGAFAGNKVEQNRNSTQAVEVVVAMEDGSERHIRVANAGTLSVGTQVRVQGDTILPR